jgi:hypothetical protein
MVFAPALASSASMIETPPPIGTLMLGKPLQGQRNRGFTCIGASRLPKMFASGFHAAT